MLKLVLAAALVTVPAVAGAQSVSTDCYSHKNRVHCSSTYYPSLGTTIREIGEMQRQRQNEKIYREGFRILEEQRRAAEEQARAVIAPVDQSPEFQTWRVRQLLAASDCPGARAYAIETGSAEQSARVEGICGKEAAK